MSTHLYALIVQARDEADHRNEPLVSATLDLILHSLSEPDRFKRALTNFRNQHCKHVTNEEIERWPNM